MKDLNKGLGKVKEGKAGPLRKARTGTGMVIGLWRPHCKCSSWTSETQAWASGKNCLPFGLEGTEGFDF